MSNNYGLGNDAEIDATVEIASAAAAAAIDESVERFTTAASGGAFIPGTSFDDGFDSVGMSMSMNAITVESSSLPEVMEGTWLAFRCRSWECACIGVYGRS
jgi:hypothetical protein